VRIAKVDDQHMRFDQHVELLLGSTSRKITLAPPPAPPAPPAQPPASTDQLIFTFHIDPSEVGEYLMRLRIDGVDSVPLDPASDVPKFADDQKLEVT
jgi:hypothetical protein